MAKKQATAANNTDEKTEQLIAEVQRRKAEINKVEKAVYKTNMTFRFNPAAPFNLHVEKDVRNLISSAAFLMDKQRTYLEAARDMGVEEAPEFEWDGYPVSEWLDDIKTKINKIQINQKKKKLELLQERLKKIISPERQAELELEAIQKELA